MNDLISRRAAIEGLYEMSSDIDHLCTLGDYVSFLESLSAQPEIIRCKDCKWLCELRDDSAFYPYCEKLFNMGMYVYDYMMKDDDFCSLAERREDG